jgi:hypothetical protein
MLPGLRECTERDIYSTVEFRDQGTVCHYWCVLKEPSSQGIGVKCFHLVVPGAPLRECRLSCGPENGEQGTRYQFNAFGYVPRGPSRQRLGGGFYLTVLGASEDAGRVMSQNINLKIIDNIIKLCKSCIIPFFV